MINSANFIKKNGKGVLVCSKCSKPIKSEDQFSTMERHAYNGDVTLLARYCKEHEHLDMPNEGKKKIKKILKEELDKMKDKVNCLGVKITKPLSKLYIMRGIPGSGKSTKAKELVGEGVIHSTDTLIEATGDYSGFFKLMIENNNFSKLSKMHNQNFLNIKKSMEDNINKIVLDNTNIKANEPKGVVKEALKLGYDDKNIIIVDIASGGLTPEELTKRNTHGVPLNKIKKMVSSHRGVGPLSVKKILESKDIHKEKILYSAVVLKDIDRSELLTQFKSIYNKGWKMFAHHMTIIFGQGIEDKSELGKEVILTATHVGVSDLCVAVKVEGYPSTNIIPHITIGVNIDAGGKPYDSNKITNWEKLPRNVSVTGIVTDIKA